MTSLRYGEEYCQSVRECVVVDMARRDGVGRQLMKQPALCVFHVLARRSKRTCERFRASRDEGCLVGQGERHIVGVELEAEPIARLANPARQWQTRLPKVPPRRAGASGSGGTNSSTSCSSSAMAN